jgi:FO synthase subunit 2
LNGEWISKEELEWMIHEAGRIPKERTTLYKGVHKLAFADPKKYHGVESRNEFIYRE